MKKIIFLSCLFVTACGSETKNETASNNNSADSICQSLNKTIESNVKEIAISIVEGDSSDRSAPQQAARYALINGKLEVIQINLKLLSENECKSPTKPIDPFSFSKIDVLKCAVASMGQEGVENVESLCDIKNWGTR